MTTDRYIQFLSTELLLSGVLFIMKQKFILIKTSDQ